MRGKYLLFILIIFFSGAAVLSLKQVKSNPSAPYKINLEIYKSPYNSKSTEVTLYTKEPTLRDVLSNSDVVWETEKFGNYEFISKLDNVITTENKEWKVYLNGVKQENVSLDFSIKRTDKIQWKYE